jgi:hypothetical protein
MGVLTYWNPCCWKKVWVAYASWLRTRVPAPMVLVRGAQVRDAAQELEGVALLLQRERGRVGGADETHRGGLHLHRLLPAGGLDDDALDLHRRARGDAAVGAEQVRAERVGRDHRLDAAQGGAVVHLDEGEILLRANRADPTAELDRVADAGDAAVGALRGRFVSSGG